ncbi:MAG: hypothetical protein WB511_03985 [Nitrososphaeraceae archaeon]
MAIFAGDFKCRSCNLTWSIFLQNNNLCNNSLLGDGRHNFDFKKPIDAHNKMLEQKIKLRVPPNKKK